MIYSDRENSDNANKCIDDLIDYIERIINEESLLSPEESLSKLIKDIADCQKDLYNFLMSVKPKRITFLQSIKNFYNDYVKKLNP